MACKSGPGAAFHDPAEWPLLDRPPALEPGEAHVWSVPLEPAPAGRAILLELLSDEERARSNRLVAAGARERFATARGALRLLLGSYAGVAPGSLAFGTGAGGKPFLEGTPELRFNVAHSGALALIGVMRNAELGVDVERRRPVPDAAALAARYFASDEARALEALPAGERSEAFLRCWTHKEAVLKATGAGLSRALDSFQVAVASSEPVRLVVLEHPEGPPDSWTLHELAPAPGYLGALAVRAPACRMRRFALRLAG